MRQMLLTVGLPGSGKTYSTMEFMKTLPPNTAVNVNRDSIREMLFGGWTGNHDDENQVTQVQRAIIKDAFRRDKLVIVSDTNLRRRNVRSLVDLAKDWGASVNFKYFTTDVEECIERDRGRYVVGERSVGEEVIRSMARKFKVTEGMFDDLLLPGTHQPDQYVPDLSKPRAIIVDLDGTVALHNRSPYDYDMLHTDSPNQPVIGIVDLEYSAGTHLLFVSGRPDSHYEMTTNWLEDNIGVYPRIPGKFNGVPRVELFMRKTGDTRKDVIVKTEIFDKHIRHDYNVLYVLDDRDQVVKGWRDMGLACLQVNYGDF